MFYICPINNNQKQNTMYTVHAKFGIGEVIDTNDKTVTVYFEEVDQTKTLITSCVVLYATIEEAENALNPELSNEEREELGAELLAESEAYKKGMAAHAWLREYNAECSKKLMRNI